MSVSDIVGSGKATAPSAAAVLASIAANLIPPGAYKITVKASVSGAAVADTENLKLVVNNADLANPLPTGASGAYITSEFNESLDGTHVVSVVVLGNATAAIGYEAEIVLTPEF